MGSELEIILGGGVCLQRMVLTRMMAMPRLENAFDMLSLCYFRFEGFS